MSSKCASQQEGVQRLCAPWRDVPFHGAKRVGDGHQCVCVGVMWGRRSECLLLLIILFSNCSSDSQTRSLLVPVTVCGKKCGAWPGRCFKLDSGKRQTNRETHTHTLATTQKATTGLSTCGAGKTPTEHTTRHCMPCNKRIIKNQRGLTSRKCIPQTQEFIQIQIRLYKFILCTDSNSCKPKPPGMNTLQSVFSPESPGHASVERSSSRPLPCSCFPTPSFLGPSILLSSTQTYSSTRSAS